MRKKRGGVVNLAIINALQALVIGSNPVISTSKFYLYYIKYIITVTKHKNNLFFIEKKFKLKILIK